MEKEKVDFETCFPFHPVSAVLWLFPFASGFFDIQSMLLQAEDYAVLDLKYSPIELNMKKSLQDERTWYAQQTQPL